MDYMSKDLVTARNTVTRKVGEYKRRLVDHPVLGKFLEEVPSGTKNFVPLSELVGSKPKPKPPFETFYENNEPEEEAE